MNQAKRIVVELHDQASQRHQRELGAFVRYCIIRMEREFGELRWVVRIAPVGGEFTSSAMVGEDDDLVEARGRGYDGALAAWDALSNLEQALREFRAAAQRRR